ncbi:hypothetical protein DFJ77DRAFT_250049 [Powellomyces hirtus]|nr:hypothetical protein DFJ77DRAFT_250049 [Powellomyces hirtus]
MKACRQNTRWDARSSTNFGRLKSYDMPDHKPQQKHTRFIPQPGTFCRVTVSTKDRPGAPRARVCYVQARVGNCFSVHFCTSFGGRHINTQFCDRPEKRDLFLPLAPTPSHNAHAPLRTADESDRYLPAYLCLYPGIQVTATQTKKRASFPVPTLPYSERIRLDTLIDKLAKKDLGEDEVRDKDDNDGQAKTKAKEDYDKDFPSLGADSRCRLPGATSAPRYSCPQAIKRWAYEVAGMQEPTVPDDDPQTMEGERQDDDWSQVSGLTPSHFLRARTDRREQALGTFSDDLSDVLLTECDPAAMFIQEARQFGAISVV